MLRAMPDTHPADRLRAAINKAGSPTCVGLDPVLESIPADATTLPPAETTKPD